jgi:hypothetical protein
MAIFPSGASGSHTARHIGITSLYLKNDSKLLKAQNRATEAMLMPQK